MSYLGSFNVCFALVVASCILGSAASAQESKEAEATVSTDFSLADMFVENWKSSKDSIVTFDAELQVFRYRFSKKHKEFDLDSFVESLKESVVNEKRDEFMDTKFAELYPNSTDPGELGKVWGFKVSVAHGNNRSRVVWHDRSSLVLFDHLHSPIGFVGRDHDLGKVNIKNAQSYEKFKTTELLLIPIFKDSNSVTVELLESTKDEVYRLEAGRFTIDCDDSGYVYRLKSKSYEHTYVKVNLLPIEDEHLGIKIPQAFVEYKFKKSGEPESLHITFVNKCRINPEFDKHELALGCPAGTRVVDTRAGRQNAKFYQTKRDYRDILRTVEKIQAIEAAQPSANKAAEEEPQNDRTSTRGEDVMKPVIETLKTGEAFSAREKLGLVVVCTFLTSFLFSLKGCE